MKPKARKTDLITQAVGDETLVYDGKDESARRLNRLSTAVWRHCTGENTVAEIAVLVAAEMELPAGVEPTLVVEGALEELESHGLLLDIGLAGAGKGDVGRREIMSVLAAIPIFPSIDKIFAPTMANAGSIPPETTATATASNSASNSNTNSNTATQSNTTSNTPTNSQTASNSQTNSQTASNSQTTSQTASNSASRSKSASTTASRSASASRSPSKSTPAPAPTPTLP